MRRRKSRSREEPAQSPRRVLRLLRQMGDRVLRVLRPRTRRTRPEVFESEVSQRQGGRKRWCIVRANQYLVDKLADVDVDDPEYAAFAAFVQVSVMLELVQEVRLLREAVERRET